MGPNARSPCGASEPRRDRPRSGRDTHATLGGRRGAVGILAARAAASMVGREGRRACGSPPQGRPRGAGDLSIADPASDCAQSGDRPSIRSFVASGVPCPVVRSRRRAHDRGRPVARRGYRLGSSRSREGNDAFRTTARGAAGSVTPRRSRPLRSRGHVRGSHRGRARLSPWEATESGRSSGGACAARGSSPGRRQMAREHAGWVPCGGSPHDGRLGSDDGSPESQIGHGNTPDGYLAGVSRRDRRLGSDRWNRMAPDQARN